MTEFEPKIVSFLCNWCAYAGADLAGVSRIQYPHNIRIIRVMCTGRIDPVIILEMIVHGADGVLMMGCHPGDCHYMEGNLIAERKIKMLKKLMEKAGFEVERLRLEWVSAGEGARFAEIIEDFTKKIKMLGPSPIAREKPDLDVLAGILAAKLSVEDFRLRAIIGREKKMVEEGNAYGEKIPQEEFDKTLDNIVNTEYVRNRIYLLLKDKPMSVKEISDSLDLDSEKVLRHIVIMKRKGLIVLDRIEGTSPLYTGLELSKGGM
jgi:coenzyme F420-reducing hydrogenase delta subunit